MELAAGDCMPARVAPVSLWTDTGAARCVTKAFSACQNQRTNSCAPHGALLTYVTLSVRVFPCRGNTRVTQSLLVRLEGVAAKHEGDQLVLAHLYLGPELVLWPRWRWASSFYLQLVLDLRRFMKRFMKRRKFQSL